LLFACYRGFGAVVNFKLIDAIAFREAGNNLMFMLSHSLPQL
jgi:hypothetical protein